MILIISDSIPTSSFKRSGIFAFDEYQNYKKRNLDVKMIILYRITYERRYFLNLKKQIDTTRLQMNEIKHVISKDNNIELISYFSFIKPFVFWEDLFLFRKSRFRKLSFEKVIVHNMLHTGLNINWIKKQFTDIPKILKEHDDWSTYPGIIRFSAIKSIRKFDRILANSESTRQSFLKILSKNNSNDNIPTIEIDYPKFKVNTKKVIKYKADALQIITVANLIKAKGFEESFDILKILDNAKIKWYWKIIGQGPYYKNIIDLATQFNFLKNILIEPEVQKPELYEYLKQADIYLQLSYAETFGIAPIEAFSYYNRLIVSNNITSINELGLNTNSNVFIIKDLTNIFKQEKEIINFISQNRNEEQFEKTLPEINRRINNNYL